MDERRKSPAAEELRRQIASERRRRISELQQHTKQIIDSHPYAALKLLRQAFPSGEEMRLLASYADIEELRKIHEPEPIAKMLTELRYQMLRWADVLDAYDRSMADTPPSKEPSDAGQPPD